MAICFYRHPVLLIEAEELLFARVNDLSPRKLASAKHGGPTAQRVAQLMEESCADIDLQDEAIQFFFKKHAMREYEPGALTCLARLLVYTFVDWSVPDLDGAVAAFTGAWSWEKMVGSRLVFDDIMPKGLSTAPWPSESPLPFVNGLMQLKAPKKLKDGLSEVFSDYRGHAARLSAILRPVAERLEPALAAYIRQAEPAIREWEALMTGLPAREFARVYLYMNTQQSFDTVIAAPLILDPGMTMHANPTEPDPAKRGIYCLINAYARPRALRPQGTDDWACTALRLLGSPARLRMVEALRQRPMTARELATALELPYVSSVTRDLNAMQVAKLLNVDFDTRQRRYHVNHASLRRLAERLQALSAPPGRDAG